MCLWEVCGALDQWWWSILCNNGSLKGKASKADLLKKPFQSKSCTRRGGKKKGSQLLSSIIVTELAKDSATPQDNIFLAPPLYPVSDKSVQVCRFIMKGKHKVEDLRHFLSLVNY